MTIFLDTSAIFAILDKDDENHLEARLAWEQLLDRGEVLLTTSYVLVEACSLLQRRIGLSAVRVLEDDIRPVLTIEWISEEVHMNGMQWLMAAGRRKLSLVDCFSFQTMRERGVRVAFCFDVHFRDAGFELLP